MLMQRLLLILALAVPGAALAQAYPTKPIRVVVPFPPGGGTDIVARTVTPKMAEILGQPFVIENRAGAGGNVGAEAAYKSDPDGYTLFASPPPPLVINHNLYPKLNFDPTQFIPLAVMGKVPNSLLTNSPRLKDAKTVADETVLLGSHNWSPGSFNRDTQDSVRIASAPLAEFLAIDFESRWLEAGVTNRG